MMKWSSIRYLIREGVKNTWVNRLMTIASVGVLVACMIIIGLAVLISENANVAIGNLEKQNVVMAYMKDYSWALYGAGAGKITDTAEKADKNGIRPSDYVIHNEEEAKALCAEIEKLDNVEKVEFISSEEGLKSATESIEESQREFFTFLEEDDGNPLPAAAKVTMKDMSKFDNTLKQIKALEGVDRVWSNSGLADTIAAVKKGITVAGAWIIAILMIISLVIVSNTIRVTMYNRKLEISIMKAVGATDAFVRIPFVVEGVLIGLVSALISILLLYFCYRIATETIINTLQTTEIVKYGDMIWILLGLFVLIGILAGVIGSVIIISKYLRKEGSEFTAI